jgi:hypothetical protein
MKPMVEANLVLPGKATADTVIAADEAVFWMDGQGRWCNAHGRLRHKKTIDYLNRCIGWDQNGWFVRHQKEAVWEKVYFHCQETALFVVDVRMQTPISLVLNTGRCLQLKPKRLIIRSDSLYQTVPVLIKFSADAAAKLISLLEENPNGWTIRIGRRRYPIPEIPKTAGSAAGNGAGQGV